MDAAVLTSLLKRFSSLPLGASSSSSTELQSSSEQELQKLAGTMKRIHALLEDAEEKDISDKSEQLRLQELKEVAYDAEDAVDEYEYDVLHAKVEARRRAASATQMGNKVILDLNYYHPEVSISHELADRVKNIRERFENITDDWSRIILSEKDGKRRCIRKWKPTETTSCFDQTKTFGREDEKNRIITWLLQEEEEEEEEEDSNGDSTVSILAIVGMGGLGKTTLAQMAYNDTRVQQCFNLRAWEYVSEEFDVASLVRKICISFYRKAGRLDELKIIDAMSLDDFHQKLRYILGGKKFLLVLDDVWNQKAELWSSLKAFLNGAGVGKILVTTRNERVARIMQTTPAIILEHLSLDDSWLLFKKIVCEGQDKKYLEIGKKIVDKCGGLPLAIKVVAGILNVEDKEEAWIDILESELWNIDKERDDIFPVLTLSYDRLPVELKQCFMYLCLFPKGSDLDRSSIVRQWISSGFIQPKGKKMEEDIGDDYCNEFLQRSILQYYVTSSSRRELRMHDLIHDLAQSVAAKNEYLLLTNPKSPYTIFKMIRHVSIRIQNQFRIKDLEPLLGEAKHLRTLVCHVDVDGEISNNIMDQLPDITSLRTLVLRTKQRIELPDSIDRLKHLRYLDILHTEIKPIPASVYKLHFLQTFSLASEYSWSKIRLSRDVGDLINLRHLSGYDSQYPLPREVAGLTNLQTFSFITLGVGDEWFKVRDLKGLRNLRGSFLQVSGLRNVAWPDVDTPPEAYLKDKRGITDLRLVWGYDAEEDELVGDVEEKERLAAQVLDSLQPHRDLETMKIEEYPGVVLPMWLAHELPVLEGLWIRGMRRMKSLVVPAMEMEKKSTEHDFESRRRRGFPSLERLTLSWMNGLEEWRQEEGAEEADPDFLPCLGDLTIEGCPKLRTLPSLLSHLDHLWIRGCPQLRRLPSLPSLTKLHLNNEFSPELLPGSCCCLPMLRRLDIRWYEGDTLILPNDGSLDPLEELTIEFCHQLRSVEGLVGLPSLRRLKIHDCPRLRMSLDQSPPPWSLQDVKITKSPRAEEWYRIQVLGHPPTRKGKQELGV